MARFAYRRGPIRRRSSRRAVGTKHFNLRTIWEGARVLRRRRVHRTVCRTTLHQSYEIFSVQVKIVCRVIVNGCAKCSDVRAGF